MAESIHPTLPDDVEVAIRTEREHQRRKYGDRPHTIIEWIAIMRSELAEAEEAWLKSQGDDKALNEINQAVATGVACMTEHGAFDRHGRVADRLD